MLYSSQFPSTTVTFKMHQIHIRPGLRPIRTMGAPHTLWSALSWNLGKGGATGRTFSPGATDPRAATVGYVAAAAVSLLLYCYYYY